MLKDQFNNFPNSKGQSVQLKNKISKITICDKEPNQEEKVKPSNQRSVKNDVIYIKRFV